MLYKPTDVLTIEAPHYVTVEGVPSRPQASEWQNGMSFCIDGLTCFITERSLRKSGYCSHRIPNLIEDIGHIAESNIPIRVYGDYKPCGRFLDVDFGNTFSNIREALRKNHL